MIRPLLPMARLALLFGAAVALAACGNANRSGDGGMFSSVTGWFGGGSGDDEPAMESDMADGGAMMAATSLPPGPVIGGQQQWAGQQSAARIDLAMTARDDRGWRILWQLVGQEPPGPMPTGAMAIAVFVDERPTAGYELIVTGVQSGPIGTTVMVAERTPSPTTPVAQIVTAPYIVALLPLTTADVMFQGP